MSRYSCFSHPWRLHGGSGTAFALCIKDKYDCVKLLRQMLLEGHGYEWVTTCEVYIARQVKGEV
jgi:hypothetical protein